MGPARCPMAGKGCARPQGLKKVLELLSMTVKWCSATIGSRVNVEAHMIPSGPPPAECVQSGPKRTYRSAGWCSVSQHHDAGLNCDL